MKTYNEKIEELNKILENHTGFELKFWHGKIEQLNELRTEAIEKVKELQKKTFNFIDYHPKDVRNWLAVIEHLKATWNITEEELK